MSGWLLEMIPIWGLWIIAGACFLSCLGFPMPSPIALVAGGGLVATGDMILWQVTVAAFCGAMAGDQAGYWLARWLGEPWLHKLARKPRRAALIARARAHIEARGDWAVFFSRWLFSPIGPWVNIATGSAGYPWARFTTIGALGEATWVAIYASMGFAFAGNVDAALSFVHRLMVPLGISVLLIAAYLWLGARKRRRAL